MSVKNSLQILHISDLHITDDPAEQFDRSVVLDPLIDRGREDRKNGFQPEIVAVTGDIAYKGVTAEYELAGDFFSDLLSSLGLSDDRLFVVPGNHDVNRKKYRPTEQLSYNDMGELNAELENYRDDLLKGMSDYFSFVEGKFPHVKPLDDRLVPFARTFTVECGRTIAVAGLNSAWMCRQSDDQGKIAIGEYQVRAAMKALDGSGPADLRLFLFHHPLDWLWSRDKAICTRHFQDGLILCGHLHDAVGGYYCDMDGNRFLFQAGGAYLGSESDWPARFNYITVDWTTNSVGLNFRKFNKDRRIWVLDTDTGDDGEKKFPLPGPGQTQEPVCATECPEIPDSYIKWIEDCCAYMETEKLHVEGEPIRIDLPEVFIPLYAYPPDSDRKKENPEEMERQMVDIEQLIAESDRLLIQGDPGSGKTTLLKHLAHGLCTGGRCPETLQGMKDMLPVLIYAKSLRGLFRNGDTETRHPLTFRTILDYYFKTIENILDADTVEAFCRAGKAVLLLDGLDELPEERQRTAVVGAFSDFKLRCPGTKLVITGRPHGLIDTASRRFGNRRVVIEPLGVDQRDTFILKWFRSVYSKDQRKGTKTADEMISEIREHPATGELTENPLMLTAVCILYYGGRELPGQRAELYDKFTANLLHRRSKDPERVRVFLMTLAHRMHTEKLKGADEKYVLEILKEFFPGNEKESENDYSRRVIDTFNDIEPECGLISRITGQCQFRHLTFQEFLTARHLADVSTDFIKAVADFWEDDWYREVVELYVSYLSINSKALANQIVKTALEAEGSPPFARWRLAARALLDIKADRRQIEITDLATERLREVISSQANIPPADRADAGESLGRLGDRRDLEAFIPVTGGRYRLSSGTVDIEPFELSRYPVTNQWFRKFADEAGGYEDQTYWSDNGKAWLKHTAAKRPGLWRDRKWNCPNAPVVGVCWYEADAFCRWLTIARNNGFTYRLPGETEWEAAATGRKGRKYPWGNRWKADTCNIKDSGLKSTSSVGIFPGGNTPEGLSDMAGNVWEWTATDYHAGSQRNDFHFDEAVQKLWDERNFDEYISSLEEKDREIPALRGGSWYFNRELARCAARFDFHPLNRDGLVGFRCARTEK